MLEKRKNAGYPEEIGNLTKISSLLSFETRKKNIDHIVFFLFGKHKFVFAETI